MNGFPEPGASHAEYRKSQNRVFNTVFLAYAARRTPGP